MFCKYFFQSVACLFISVTVPFAKQMVFVLMTSNLAVCSLLAALSVLWGTECSGQSTSCGLRVLQRHRPYPCLLQVEAPEMCPAPAAPHAQEMSVGLQLGASPALRLPSPVPHPSSTGMWPLPSEKGFLLFWGGICALLSRFLPFYFFPQPCPYLRSSGGGALSPPPRGHRQCDGISI